MKQRTLTLVRCISALVLIAIPCAYVFAIQNFCLGLANGRYPYVGDRTIFIECFNNHAYIYHCGAGLIYDDRCKCCNYPSK